MPPHPVKTLSALQVHVLLALSARVNLLLACQDASPTSFTRTINTIQAFVPTLAAKRTIRVLQLTEEQAGSMRPADLLRRISTKGSDKPDETEGVPDILVIPYIDLLPPNCETVLLEVLRDRQFVSDDQSFILSQVFTCIALLTGPYLEATPMSRHLVSIVPKPPIYELIPEQTNRFGISLTVAEAGTSTPNLHFPIIPKDPPLYSTPELGRYAADLLSAVRALPSWHNYLFTNQCTKSTLVALATLWVRLKHATTDETGKVTYPKDGEIRPRDVQEVFSSLVTHRVRYREDQERLDAFWGAPAPPFVSVNDSLQYIFDTV